MANQGTTIGKYGHSSGYQRLTVTEASKKSCRCEPDEPPRPKNRELVPGYTEFACSEEAPEARAPGARIAARPLRGHAQEKLAPLTRQAQGAVVANWTTVAEDRALACTIPGPEFEALFEEYASTAIVPVSRNTAP